MNKFSEINHEELLDVTGGLVILGVTVTAALVGKVILGLGGATAAIWGTNEALEKIAYDKAYEKAYEAELERLNSMQ